MAQILIPDEQEEKNGYWSKEAVLTLSPDRLHTLGLLQQELQLCEFLNQLFQI